jgi:flagellar basal-body rod modification protein FlgD
MEILGQESSVTAAATGGALTIGSRSSEVLGKEEFLKLLTVQLAHQDPLDPVSNEAFVAQLAQFSSLEQMQNMNRSLETSQLLDRSINNSLAAGLIGREVRASGGSLRLESGRPAEFFVGLGAAARVTVSIRNAAGQLVRSLEVGALTAGESRILWDGKDDAGEPLPGGDYRISVEAIDGAGRPVSASGATTGLVTGLRFSGGQALLIVNGREVPLDEVLEIRSSQSE